MVVIDNENVRGGLLRAIVKGRVMKFAMKSLGRWLEIRLCREKSAIGENAQLSKREGRNLTQPRGMVASTLESANRHLSSEESR